MDRKKVAPKLPRVNPAKTKPQSQVVMVRTEDATFDDLLHILRRLRLWANIFWDAAQSKASGLRGEQLSALVKGLEEKRFTVLDEHSLERFETALLNQRDPIELWRMCKALENHQIELVKHVEQRFPEQKDRIKWFRCVNAK